MSIFSSGIYSQKTVERMERIRFILLLLLVFSLPYNILFSSVILLTLLASTLPYLSKTKVALIPRQVWIFQLLYFLSLVGYFYSNNTHEAGFLLERQLTILLIPIILPLAITITEKRIRSFLIMLSITSACAVAYLFLHLFYTIIFELKAPVAETILSGTFFNHQFSKPIHIHAGYLSLYVSTSALFIISELNKKSSVALKAMLLSVLLILCVGLFFLASRNTIIATFFIALFIFPLFKKQHRLRYMFVSLCFVILTFFIIHNVPYFNVRFYSGLITEIRPLQNGSGFDHYSAEPRVERWKGALALIKRSPSIGYGTGDETNMLKTEYIKRGQYIAYEENLNAHNQYLSYAIKNGIIGLCLFLFAFYYFVSLSIKARDFMYLAFLLLLLIGFYTENILDANKGILFFALFNTLFGYQSLQDKAQKALQ